MNRGEKLWVNVDGSWQEASYEFRVENAEPLGQHSVMLASGAGRRVVCSCCTRLERSAASATMTPQEESAYLKGSEAAHASHLQHALKELGHQGRLDDVLAYLKAEPAAMPPPPPVIERIRRFMALPYEIRDRTTLSINASEMAEVVKYWDAVQQVVSRTPGASQGARGGVVYAWGGGSSSGPVGSAGGCGSSGSGGGGGGASG